MGAGRLFALIVVLAAAPVAAAGSALSQASAVGPWAALSQGSGLELRDAFNRPISREALASELKAVARAEAAQSAPAATRAWSEFVERAAGPADTVRGALPARSTAAAVPAPARRLPKTHLLSILIARIEPASAPRFATAVASMASSPDRARVLPLRL